LHAARAQRLERIARIACGHGSGRGSGSGSGRGRGRGSGGGGAGETGVAEPGGQTLRARLARSNARAATAAITQAMRERALQILVAHARHAERGRAAHRRRRRRCRRAWGGRGIARDRWLCGWRVTRWLLLLARRAGAPQKKPEPKPFAHDARRQLLRRVPAADVGH
jgi:hypothetical protein